MSRVGELSAAAGIAGSYCEYVVQNSGSGLTARLGLCILSESPRLLLRSLELLFIIPSEREISRYMI